MILDEAANICRIADLPELYSHLGSRGMVPVTILQSYQQGVAVWGEPGMAALWGAATKKVIGAGIDDPRHARDLATLTGQHDVPVISVSYGDGRASQQVSLRRQEILDAADIRALAPGSALLLATGARPALISLRPWYSGPHAPQITAAIGRAEAAMQRAAQHDHPGARPAAMPFQHRRGVPVMTIQPGTGPSANGDGTPAPQPVYSSVEEWVTSHFLPMFRRPLGGEYRWCAQWWRHAEAITRLTALWHTWEALRLQPGTGMATWLRDHLDHQLPVLLGRTGPFSMCSEDEHIDPRQATAEQPPPGWWDVTPRPAAPSGDASLPAAPRRLSRVTGTRPTSSRGWPRTPRGTRGYPTPRPVSLGTHRRRSPRHLAAPAPRDRRPGRLHRRHRPGNSRRARETAAHRGHRQAAAAAPTSGGRPRSARRRGPVAEPVTRRSLRAVGGRFPRRDDRRRAPGGHHARAGIRAGRDPARACTPVPPAAGHSPRKTRACPWQAVLPHADEINLIQINKDHLLISVDHSGGGCLRCL